MNRLTALGIKSDDVHQINNDIENYLQITTIKKPLDSGFYYH
ncbi:hypothetical protein [Thalassotalea algicola]|nr:hypothetical protein [Thalassotalea algicola]